jgi:chaperone BCS1
LRLFCTIFEQADGDQGVAKKQVKDNKTIERLAKEFASKMSRDKFSPAEILELLVENKQSPANAVANIDKWVVKARKERSKLQREDSWVHNA